VTVADRGGAGFVCVRVRDAADPRRETKFLLLLLLLLLWISHDCYPIVFTIYVPLGPLEISANLVAMMIDGFDQEKRRKTKGIG